MTPLEQQFEILRGQCAGATLNQLPDGAHLITIPAYPLPDGWSKQVTEIKFIAPVGYPFARPDCFWTDADLKLKSGGVPINTGGQNPIPHIVGAYRPKL